MGSERSAAEPAINTSESFWVIYPNTILKDLKITAWKVVPLAHLEELRIYWSLTSA